ncbi:MAG TPA: DUF262 domain-containing protein [Stellaceae bacterium]|jgi:hypothetical protein
MDLMTEIEAAQRTVTTDSYQMSIGEIVNMYKDKELIISPVFQRLFRWELSQKSRLIESILIGIPLPSIFVYELPSGKWELVDGLQRISTLLEFMGLLEGPNGEIKPPSILESTKYLPSLHNVVWEGTETIADTPVEEQNELPKNLQLTIRRSRISVEILKRPSDPHTKYELFQRLNGGGSIANAQELRNCIIVMVNDQFFEKLRKLTEWDLFSALFRVSEDQQRQQRNIEFLTRFLVYRYIPYDGKLDVEEYIDAGIIEIAEGGIFDVEAEKNLRDTITLLHDALGNDALRQFEDGRARGRVGLTAIEIVAVGVSFNLPELRGLNDPRGYVKERVLQLWNREEVKTFSRAGLRGTLRIQKTIPFGRSWFAPQPA